ncbi:MAG TPA: protein kinase [Ktedonobacteraceae bacterium]|nr:protein kinase [Ktedonobacteraceae bacterium]
MEPAIGTLLGNYRLVREIGTGGFAHVYLAKHIYLETEAAIKVLDTGFDRERFLQEARVIARLRHPSIVSTLEFGIEEDVPYLVMEYAPYGSLRTRHPRGAQVPLSTVASYVQQVASALQYAHAQRVVHCDVKPENMLVGEHDQILLGDFGIARVVQNTVQTTRDVVGTVYYMAPEQFAGKALPASDQYALGVVVYQWLSGRLPFGGNNIAEMFFMHTHGAPMSLCSLVPGLPSAVERVVFKALEKGLQQRFPNMAAFAAAFEEAAQATQQPFVRTVPTSPDNLTVFAPAPTIANGNDAGDWSRDALDWPPTLGGWPSDSVAPPPQEALPGAFPSLPLLPSIIPLEDDEAAAPFEYQLSQLTEPAEPLLLLVPPAPTVFAEPEASLLVPDDPVNVEARLPLPSLASALPVAPDDGVAIEEAQDIEEQIATVLMAPESHVPAAPSLAAPLPSLLLHPPSPEAVEEVQATINLPTLMEVLPAAPDASALPDVSELSTISAPLFSSAPASSLEPVSLPPADLAEDSSVPTIPLITLMEILPVEPAAPDVAGQPSPLFPPSPAGPGLISPSKPPSPPPSLSVGDSVAATVEITMLRDILPPYMGGPMLSPSPEPSPVPSPHPPPLPTKEIEIFTSYSHLDMRYRKRLDSSLASLRRAYPAVVWNDGAIRAGMDFREEIANHLEQAHIILLLISDNFLNSEYCNEEELKPAMRRHHAGAAHVIPVILSHCLWRIAPFGKLQALPDQGKALAGWNPRSAGYANVAEGIEKVIKYILNLDKH